MGLKDRAKIFKARKVLDSSYVPDTLQDRKTELKEIEHYISYALDGGIPPDLLVVGVTGSGKTVSVKYVLNELREVMDILNEFVIANGTAYQILTRLARKCGCDVPIKGMGFVEVWDKFEEILHDVNIFVLDEIDKTLIKDGEKLLYHLSRHPNICTIGISNNLNAMGLIKDERVSSSFTPKKINFPPYNANQLREILEYRAELAFHPNVLDDEVIPLCSALAARKSGDARYALELLSTSADVAIRRNSTKVTEEDVKIAEGETEREFIRHSIENLSESQRLLLYSVLNSKEGESPTRIYQYFNIINRKVGISPLTQRRLSELLKQLELLGLIDIERRGRKGRGKGVDWYVYPSIHLDIEMVKEVIERSFEEILA